MISARQMRCGLLFIVPVLAAAASNYSAESRIEGGVEVIHLADRKESVEVSIVPSVGNRVCALAVHGQNLLYFPPPNAAALKSGQPPSFSGIPFLAPWANRLAGGSFWANGKKYPLNSELGTVSVNNSGIAIHGMLAGSSLWRVTALQADEQSASVTSRLDFWRSPELMANWPFAHQYEMTYRLAHGVLQVTTNIKNLSTEPMPVAIGFHPYFKLPGTQRSEQSIHIPARKHVETDLQLIATGKLTANELPEKVSLKDHTFDDGFTDLVRNSEGIAMFSVEAGSKMIQVIYGPKYQVAVVYAPPGEDFICFEPMTAITNGLNLAHEGKYPELQSVAAGATWSESFSIRWNGF